MTEQPPNPPDAVPDGVDAEQPDAPAGPVVPDAPADAVVPDTPDGSVPPPSRLVELAHACNVATEFWDWQGEHVTVSDRTIRAVLGALGLEVDTDEVVEAALAEVQERPWREVLPPVVVVRGGVPSVVPVHVDQGTTPKLWVELEDGGTLDLEPDERESESRGVGERTVVELTYVLPADLTLGWHTIHARHTRGEQTAPLVVTPSRLELPPPLVQGRAWGYMTQLYSVRSQTSWGLGDLADLTELASWSARAQGAGFVLVNPLHAAEPIPPMEPSPYLPTTRRFANPIYLRVEDIREVAYLPATDRAIVEWQAEAMRLHNTDPGTLDRDAVWAAKLSALETIYVHPRSPARQAAFEKYCDREGDGLRDFATWCTLAERYGLPSSTWPAHAADPRSKSVQQLREEMSERVRFHMWLQWCTDEQLTATQRVALESGMSVGIIHDMAVGVHADGADAWALGDVLAGDVTAGAPPDAFNQQGQNWNQPPWRPDRLAELAYGPYRDMLRTNLRHAGGLRIDHIIGLFRLWWIPRGASPAEGTYVRYDHEALMGILALEAHRHGAVLIGEDLGTVEPWARDYLCERGILGTSILWFEKDEDGRLQPPEAWRELCLATITTHDLPPTAGYLAGEHIELRDRLGLLTRPVEEEMIIDRADQSAMLSVMVNLGLLGAEATERERVEALHAFLTRTPARLIGVSLADAVGDRRTMNQPGTSDEYPNWRLPLADGIAQPVLLEQIMTSVRTASLARAVSTRGPL